MKLHWTYAATADIERLWNFLAETSPEYADKIEARIIERADQLTRFPHLGRPLRSTGARVLSIPDIQHTMDYQIDDDVIWIVRVRSTRENRERQ